MDGFIAITKLNNASLKQDLKIQIEIKDRKYNTKFQVLLTPEQFANAITGTFEECKYNQF